MTSIDIERLRTWIGRTAEAEDVITPRLAASLLAVLDDDGETVERRRSADRNPLVPCAGHRQHVHARAGRPPGARRLSAARPFAAPHVGPAAS